MYFNITIWDSAPTKDRSGTEQVIAGRRPDCFLLLLFAVVIIGNVVTIAGIKQVDR